jgi:hypothetical protein
MARNPGSARVSGLLPLPAVLVASFAVPYHGDPPPTRELTVARIGVANSLELLGRLHREREGWPAGRRRVLVELAVLHNRRYGPDHRRGAEVRRAMADIELRAVSRHE